jgi:tRNA G26 N,N-dimethylase Trm1
MNIDLKHIPKLPSHAQAEHIVDILVFKTNIRLKKDVRKIATLFDGHPLIKRWSVDITDIDKVIRIESINLLPGEVINALESAGYCCEELPD